MRYEEYVTPQEKRDLLEIDAWMMGQHTTAERVVRSYLGHTAPWAPEQRQSDYFYAKLRGQKPILPHRIEFLKSIAIALGWQPEGGYINAIFVVDTDINKVYQGKLKKSAAAHSISIRSVEEMAAAEIPAHPAPEQQKIAQMDEALAQFTRQCAILNKLTFTKA